MGQFQAVGFGSSISVPEDLFILNPMHQHMITDTWNYGYLWNKFGWGVVISLLVFIIFVVVSAPQIINEVRLSILKTEHLDAQVTDHRVSRGKSTSYYVTYTFTVNERTYSREESVSSGEYNTLEVGGRIAITYAVNDPNTSHVGGSGFHWKSILGIFFFAVFILIIGIIWTVQAMPNMMRIRRLRRDGQLIFGRLMSSSDAMIKRGSGKSKRTDYDVTIYYRFMTLTEKTIDTKATFTRNDLKNKLLQTTGSVAILYVSDSDYMVL